MKQPKIKHCFNCGTPMATFCGWDDGYDTCGARECEREARYAREAERSEAHEQLDRDMGY